jgi:menaquinone-dependent protoporphyrinogen oxidase
MKAIVVYASKYGSTKGIAEFIAEKLQQQGTQADVRPVDAVHNLGDYDALVVGSAAYMMHWLKEAVEFVRRNRAVLANKQVWLFSSGPLGTEVKDAQGRDLRVVSEAKEIAEFRGAINPLDHRVFFGAFDRKKLGFKDRMVAKTPAARAMFPEGDFRNWKDIEAWASSIAQELKGRQTSPHVASKSMIEAEGP